MHNLILNRIRLSAGSAAVLGLISTISDVDPTTCYMMTPTSSPCRGKCAFCPQGYMDNDKNINKLSRIQWPEFEWIQFLERMEQNQNELNGKKFKRACLQVINSENFFPVAYQIIADLHQKFPKLLLSGAFPPISVSELNLIHQAGLERIAIALDACTSSLFQQIKGRNMKSTYTWENHWQVLENALNIFGKGFVTTHFIVGLGETEKDMIESIAYVIKKTILPGLFFFTPIKGTPMAKKSRPSIIQFRHIQLARYLLLKNPLDLSRFQYNDGQLIKISKLTELELRNIIDNEFAFRTAGCPDCNRPYYNSRPDVEQDGFPCELKEKEKSQIYAELKNLLSD